MESDNVTRERACVARNRTRNNSVTRVAGWRVYYPQQPSKLETKTRNSPVTVCHVILCSSDMPPCFEGPPPKQKNEHRWFTTPPALSTIAPAHKSESSTASGKPQEPNEDRDHFPETSWNPPSTNRYAAAEWSVTSPAIRAVFSASEAVFSASGTPNLTPIFSAAARSLSM